MRDHGRERFGGRGRIGRVLLLTALAACAGGRDTDGEPDDAVPAPTTDPWENARRRGVEFRAVGNEPGWYMEIDAGRQILLVADYGEARYVFPAPAPQVDPAAGRTIYRTSAEGRQLTVVLLERPCADVMSGQRFPTTVTVRVDGREYQGCGQRLD